MTNIFTHPSPPPSGERAALLSESPEINQFNYSNDEVVALNDWCIRAYEFMAADAQEIESLTVNVNGLSEALRREIEAPTFMGEPVSLLCKPTKHCSDLGPCHCPPGKCSAPIIDGRQAMCLRNVEIKAQKVAVPQGWKLVDVDQIREIVRDIHQHVQQGHLSEVHVAKQNQGYGTGIYTHIWHQINKLSAALAAEPQLPQAERVPMTDKDIAQVYTTATNQHLHPCDVRLVVLVVRGVEAFHNIKP